MVRMLKGIFGIFVVIFVFSVLLVSFGAVLVTCGAMGPHEICRESSPDGEYEVVLYQVGSTGWFFSPASARLKVLDGKGRTVAKIEFQINNDGTGVEKKNIQGIRWYDDRVEVDIRGWDDSDPTTYNLAW